MAIRDKLTELAGSFALAPIVCAACTAPWALLQSATPWGVLGRVFLLSTALTWAVLLVGRLPRRNDQNPWGRRAIQLAAGLGIGALAFWLDGWGLPSGTATASTRDLVLWTGHRVSPEALSVGVRYLFYFGLAVAACRWWIATERTRRERVRVVPIVAAGVLGHGVHVPVAVGVGPSDSGSGAARDRGSRGAGRQPVDAAGATRPTRGASSRPAGLRA